VTALFRRAARPDPNRLGEAIERLSAFAALRGEEKLSQALAAAAPRVRSAEPDLLDRQAAEGAGPFALLPDEGRALVVDLFREGDSVVLERERRRLPHDIARLLAHPDVTPADVLALHRRFGAVTGADLAEAVELAGRETTDREAIALRERFMRLLPSLRDGHPRLPLGRARAILEDIRSRLAGAGHPAATAFVPVGSVRRFEPTVGDLELLAASAAAPRVIEGVLEVLAPAHVLHRGSGLATVHVHDEQVTFRVVPPEELGAQMVRLTGSPAHLRSLKAHADTLGISLSGRDISDARGVRIRAATEEELYGALALQYVAPELRQGLDEVALAREGRLPPLVERRHIRGDLHTHTLWSDGRDSVDSMVYAARRLGYEYVAITDHSERTAASRTLTRDRLARQREDVERMRARMGELTILHGIEVEILPDGSLDFADDVLEGLDVVLASLHDAAQQPPDRLLARYIGAMRHPMVGIITHPANRLVGRHDGYALDYDALFAAAVETGTALEIDGAPGHLDLDGTLARRAVAAGVTVSIDSDCHSAARLGRQMDLGIGTARRGGVEPRHVLNTRSFEEVRAFFQAKRQRLGRAS
jgi:DNA polymerase (family X)